MCKKIALISCDAYDYVLDNCIKELELCALISCSDYDFEIIAEIFINECFEYLWLYKELTGEDYIS